MTVEKIRPEDRVYDLDGLSADVRMTLTEAIRCLSSVLHDSLRDQPDGEDYSETLEAIALLTSLLKRMFERRV